MKLFIPAKLKRYPLYYSLACQCKTQEAVDRIVKIAFKPFVSDEQKKKIHGDSNVVGAKGDAQMAGTYSLDACQGGSKYHVLRKKGLVK